jgi:moderate conductance mechanosensitive channel
MIPSRVSRLCLATLVAWWGLIVLRDPGSAAQVQEVTKPVAANAKGESQAGEIDAEQKLAAELAGLRGQVKAVAEALESKKEALAPRVRAAESHVQQVSAALQQAVGPDASTSLEEELRLTQESLSLLERELALAEEEVTVAEGMVMVTEKRAIQRRAKEQKGAEGKDDSLTAQDARVATEEAKVAAEKVSIAQGKVETLQDELRTLEKEVAENTVLGTTIDQEVASVTAQLSTLSGGEEKDILERQLRRAKQRAEMHQKRIELTRRQLDLTRSKYELAQREDELLTTDMEILEARAQAIRDSVGVSLDDIKAEQEQAMVAQKAAETEKQKAQQQQAAAQQERARAQEAIERAKIAREQAKTPDQQRLAELTQFVAEKKAELAQKKGELAREKIDVAEKAAEMAQKRLEVTSYRLESERKGRTATEILNTYEWAKAEAAKAAKDVRSARSAAELAKQETESLRREAELAQLKAQVESNQLDRPSTDPIVRSTIRALEESARVAQDRAQVAEERAAVVQDRAHVVSEKANLLHELEAQLALQRSTYQLWKREPSKITWDVLEQVSTDLVSLRSALIIGVSTLPEQLIHLGSYLTDPRRFWRILGQSVLVVLLLLLAVCSGLSLRRKLQPLIARQKDHFLPSTSAKLLRAGTRLIAAVALPLMLFVAGLLMGWLAAGGREVFVVFSFVMGGLVAYSSLKGIAQELFMPWDPQQRLIACRNGIASYLYRHLHRISAYVCVFLTVIAILRAINYHQGIIALLAVLFYLGLLVLLVLLTSNKEAVLGLLPNAENRLEKIIYVAATQVYPLIVLLVICIITLQSLGYVNLARFLLTATLLTGVILAVAHFAGKGLDKLLRWWLVPEGREEGDFLFGREATETLYTILSHAVGYLAYLIAVVTIAGTWGVDLSGVYATLTSPTAQGYYRRLVAAITVIIVSTVILRTAYYVIDKVFDIPPEEARAWRKKIALGDKGKTIAPLLKNLLKYCTIFVAGVLVLRVLGVDPTPIIAGAGVVGLAVGFGAQTLVKDVISGFFLLFEGLIAVGDVISFGNSAGLVEEVGLRVTKYRTFAGELWVIPNGEIRAFGNSNRQWMRAVVVVGVAYEQDVSKAMRVLDEVGKAWAEERRDIVLETPQVQGILSFDESSITLRLAIKVKPSQQGTAEWELRRRIKEAFDREGVEIPFPRRVLYTRQETDGLNGEEANLRLLPQRVQKVVEAQDPTEKEPRVPSPTGRGNIYP